MKRRNVSCEQYKCNANELPTTDFEDPKFLIVQTRQYMLLKYYVISYTARAKGNGDEEKTT